MKHLWAVAHTSFSAQTPSGGELINRRQSEKDVRGTCPIMKAQ